MLCYYTYFSKSNFTSEIKFFCWNNQIKIRLLMSSRYSGYADKGVIEFAERVCERANVTRIRKDRVSDTTTVLICPPYCIPDGLIAFKSGPLGLVITTETPCILK